MSERDHFCCACLRSWGPAGVECCSRATVELPADDIRESLAVLISRERHYAEAVREALKELLEGCADIAELSDDIVEFGAGTLGLHDRAEGALFGPFSRAQDALTRALEGAGPLTGQLERQHEPADDPDRDPDDHGDDAGPPDPPRRR